MLYSDFESFVPTLTDAADADAELIAVNADNAPRTSSLKSPVSARRSVPLKRPKRGLLSLRQRSMNSVTRSTPLSATTLTL